MRNASGRLWISGRFGGEMFVLIKELSKNRRKLGIFIEVFPIIVKYAKTLVLLFCNNSLRKSTLNGYETDVNMTNMTGSVNDKLRRRTELEKSVNELQVI